MEKRIKTYNALAKNYNMPPMEEFFKQFDTEEGLQKIHSRLPKVFKNPPSFNDFRSAVELPNDLRKLHGIPAKYGTNGVPEYLYDRNPETGKPARIFIDNEGVTTVASRSDLPPNPALNDEVEKLKNQMLNTRLMSIMAGQTTVNQPGDPRAAGMQQFVGDIDPKTGQRSYGILEAPIPLNPFYITKSMMDGVTAGVTDLANLSKDIYDGRVDFNSDYGRGQIGVRALAATAKVGISALTPVSLMLQAWGSANAALQAVPNEDFQNIVRFVMAPGSSLAEKYFKLSPEEQKSVGNYGVDPTILALGELVDLATMALATHGVVKMADGASYSAARYRAWREGRMDLSPAEAKYYGEVELSQVHKVADRIVKGDWQFRHEKPGVMAYGPGDATSYIEVLPEKVRADGKTTRNKAAYVVTRPDGSSVLANSLGEAKTLAHSYYAENGYVNLDRFKPMTTFEVEPGTTQSGKILGASPEELAANGITQQGEGGTPAVTPVASRPGSGTPGQPITPQSGNLRSFTMDDITSFNHGGREVKVTESMRNTSIKQKEVLSSSDPRLREGETVSKPPATSGAVVGPDGKIVPQAPTETVTNAPLGKTIKPSPAKDTIITPTDITRPSTGDVVDINGSKYRVTAVSPDGLRYQGVPVEPPRARTAIENLGNKNLEIAETTGTRTKRLGLSEQFAPVVQSVEPVARQVRSDIAKRLKSGEIKATDVPRLIRDEILSRLKAEGEYGKLGTDVKTKLYAVANAFARKLKYDKASAELLMPEEMKNLNLFRERTYQEEFNAQLAAKLVGKHIDAELLNKINRDYPEVFGEATARVTKSRFFGVFYSKLKEFATKYGNAGGHLVNRLYQGDVMFGKLTHQAAPYLAELRAISESMRETDGVIGFHDSMRKVAEALEDRANAGKILGGDALSEKFYNSAVQLFDMYRKMLEERGIKVEEDYFPHMFRFSGTEELLRKYFNEHDGESTGMGNMYAKVNADAASLKPRQGQLEEWNMNALDVINAYVRNVNRELAYADAIDWLYSRKEGFRSMLSPTTSRIGKLGREPAGGMAEAIDFYRRSIFDNDEGGRAFRAAQKLQTNFFHAVISYSLKNKLQNRLQVELSRAGWTPEATKLFDKTWNKGFGYLEGSPTEAAVIGSALTQYPNLGKVLSEAARFIPESLDQLIGESLHTDLAKGQGKYTRLFNKYDWFAKSEIANWKDSLLGNIYDVAMHTEEFKARRGELMGKIKDEQVRSLTAINDILANPKVFEHVMERAGLLTAETQVSTMNAMRGMFYDKKWLRMLGMFTQFKFRQFQLVKEHVPFFQKGSRGALAYSILRRGAEHEVIPVEVLREVEVQRKGFESLLKEMRKTGKDVGVDAQTVRGYIEFLKDGETQLNAQIKTLAGRMSGARRAGILAKYFGTTAAISASFSLLNRMINEAGNQLVGMQSNEGIGGIAGQTFEKEEDKDSGARRLYNLYRDISPIPLDVVNPAETFTMKFLTGAKNQADAGFSANSSTKMLMNVAPWYLSLPNRALGDVPRKAVASTMSAIGGVLGGDDGKLK